LLGTSRRLRRGPQSAKADRWVDDQPRAANTRVGSLAEKRAEFYTSRRAGISAAGGTSNSQNTTVQKLVLMSVIIASIVIPAHAARLPDPRVGLKKVVVQVAIFNLVYLFLLNFVVGRL
jgi:hypothetical protein